MKKLMWTVGDLEEVKQPKPSSTTQVYEICYGREGKNNLILENSDDDLDGRDMPFMSSPQRQEDQFSCHIVKHMDRSFSRKLRTVEEHIKGIKLSRRACQRCAGKMPSPTECDGMVSLSPSYQKKYNQNPRARRANSGQANDVNYIPLDGYSSATEEVPENFSSPETGDVQKMSKQTKNKSRVPKGFHVLTRALSGLLTTRDQAAESSDKQHFWSH